MNYQEAIDKAAKLLRKGNNAATTKEEASAFIEKAQQIISEYRLNIDDLDFDKNQQEDDKEEVKDFGWADALDKVKYGNYRESWTIRLASLVSYQNQCVIRHYRRSDKGTDIKVIGRPSDVSATRYLYSFFRNQIEELQKVHCKGSSSTFKGEFAFGCIDTLKERLEAQAKAQVEEVRTKHSGNEMALVRVNSAVARIEKRREDVDDFLNRYHYESIAENIDCTVQEARLIAKYRRTELKALVGEVRYAELMKRWTDYCDDLAKKYKGVRLGSGPRGFGGAGERTSTGGREAGREAGKSIRMTGSKGGLGGGTKQIS